MTITYIPAPKDTAPCPVCAAMPKLHKSERGFSIGCVGDRHCVQLYRGTSEGEVLTAWNRLFGGVKL